MNGIEEPENANSTEILNTKEKRHHACAVHSCSFPAIVFGYLLSDKTGNESIVKLDRIIRVKGEGRVNLLH